LNKVRAEKQARKTKGRQDRPDDDMNLLVGNFDFEHHLGTTVPRTMSAQIRRLNHEMAFCLAPLAEPGDCLWTPALPEPEFARHLEQIGLPGLRFVSRAEEVPTGVNLIPWGWCRSVEKWAAKQGWSVAAPDLPAVARANSREFSAGLESEWGVGLPGAHAIRTLSDLERALSEIERAGCSWVIKANFGMSARERILGRQAPPREQDVEWARRRLERGEAIYFEPWVHAVAEFGCQLTVPPAGPPVLEGVTGLLTDAQGTYRGSRLFESSEIPNRLPANVLDVVDRAARRIQELGYFGPLGIDVMQYRTSGGESGWRPLQDINARLTMGRVALGLRRLLAPGQSADWLHFRNSSSAADQEPSDDLATVPAGARQLRTSPRETGGRPANRGTALLIAESAEVLEAVSEAIRRMHEHNPG
jgi:hypothetical protein